MSLKPCVLMIMSSQWFSSPPSIIKDTKTKQKNTVWVFWWHWTATFLETIMAAIRWRAALTLQPRDVGLQGECVVTPWAICQFIAEQQRQKDHLQSHTLAALLYTRLKCSLLSRQRSCCPLDQHVALVPLSAYPSWTGAMQAKGQRRLSIITPIMICIMSAHLKGDDLHIVRIPLYWQPYKSSNIVKYLTMWQSLCVSFEQYTLYSLTTLHIYLLIKERKTAIALVKNTLTGSTVCIQASNSSI